MDALQPETDPDEDEYSTEYEYEEEEEESMICGWCEKRIWPWQSYGHRVMATGTVRWHGECGRKVDRIQRDTQRQYQATPASEYQKQQWRLRAEEEDRL